MIFPGELAQDPDLFMQVASRIYGEPGLLDKMYLSGISGRWELFSYLPLMKEGRLFLSLLNLKKED